MALYAFVALKYLAPLDRMLQTVDRHRAYLRELHAQGKMVCSGPFVPREGGAMLLRIDDPSEIGPLLANWRTRVATARTKVFMIISRKRGRSRPRHSRKLG